MSHNNSIPTETMTKISQLLLKGDRTQDVAKATNLTTGRVAYIRSKMVAAGILNRQRAARKTKSKNRPVVQAKPTPTQSVNLAKVLGNQGFKFRINDMEIHISEATQVYVKRGSVEIKY